MLEVTSVGHLACTYYWAIICHPKSLSLLPPFFICIICTNSKKQNILTEWTTSLVPVLKQTVLFGGVKHFNSMTWWWFSLSEFQEHTTQSQWSSKLLSEEKDWCSELQTESCVWGFVLFHTHDTQGKTSDSSEDRIVFGILQAQCTFSTHNTVHNGTKCMIWCLEYI